MENENLQDSSHTADTPPPPQVSPPQIYQLQTSSAPPPNDKKSKSKTIILSIVAILVVLIVTFGVLIVLQISRANIYLSSAKEFSSSVAVKQLDESLVEFSTSADGLYKDMYFCRATSSQIFSSSDVASKELAIRKKYQDSYSFLKQNKPEDYKTLPLVGGIGKSAEAKRVNNDIVTLVTQLEQFTGKPDGYDGYLGNEYSQYCMNSLYNMLSSFMPYLPQFANADTLSQSFSDGSTYAQQKLDQLALFESYDISSPPNGFEELDKLQSEYVGGVRTSLQGLLVTENTNPRNTLYLGNKHSDFDNNINTFDESLVPEAKRQAEKYIVVDVDEILSSLNSIKELANQ